MLKNWIIYILALLGAEAFFIVNQMWFSWLCVVVVCAIPFFSAILSVLSFFFFSVRVKVPHMITMKTETEIVFSSKTSKYLPGQLYAVRMTIRELMSGAVQKHRFTCQIGTDYPVRLETDHCGTYVIDSIKVRVYDMFGLIPIPKKVELKGSIPVLPVQRLPSIVEESNGFRAKILSKSNSPYSEIYDVREYMAGDPVKSVHWKMSAKKDDIMVREPQEETHGRARLVMPLHGSRDRVDQNLGEVLFTIKYFLLRDIPVDIKVVSRTRRPEEFQIRSKQEMDHTMLKILRMPIEGGQHNE